MILTTKERLILIWKEEGKTVEQIAQTLIISKRHAQRLIQELYNKCNCNNGIELIHWAYQNDILEKNGGKVPPSTR